jgi:thiamine biosynthesis lipoprotein
MSEVQVQGGMAWTANPAVQLDFGGYAKGYALDLAARLIRERGLGGLINAGGNVMAVGGPRARTWTVALANPAGDPPLMRLDLADGECVGVSGDDQRGFTWRGRRFGHLIDPRTGAPVDGPCSATVVTAGPGAGVRSEVIPKCLLIDSTHWRERAARLGAAQTLMVGPDGRPQFSPAMRLRVGTEDREAAVA